MPVRPYHKSVADGHHGLEEKFLFPQILCVVSVQMGQAFFRLFAYGGCALTDDFIVVWYPLKAAVHGCLFPDIGSGHAAVRRGIGEFSELVGDGLDEFFMERLVLPVRDDFFLDEAEVFGVDVQGSA